MIRSMTGYGRAQSVIDTMSVTVELKSVNHRYFEFNSRVPRNYGFLEEKLKSYVGSRVTRGKVECYVSIENLEDDEVEILVNHSLAKSYLNALNELADRNELNLRDDLAISSLARYNDVFVVHKNEADEEKIWNAVKEVASSAVDKFIFMRETEGEKLKNDILSRADLILNKVSVIEERSPETVKEYNEKLLARIKEFLSDVQVDEQRLLTECAIFADKIAVAEETVRLRSHIDQLRQFLESSEAVGRKTDFLVQEMNREANTIGSKAQDVTIARNVIDIKAEIEKIREQIQNIEWGISMKLINIGFGNAVNADRVIAIVSTDSAPVKRIIAEAKDRHMLIDATQGRKTQAVIIMDSDHVVSTYLKAETILNRTENIDETEVSGYGG